MGGNDNNGKIMSLMDKKIQLNNIMHKIQTIKENLKVSTILIFISK